jgi:CO/xanthine dehydrogenase FAD-binding subunit
MHPLNFIQPKTIEELAETLLRMNDTVLIAGGTDLLPRMHRGVRLAENIIDLSKMYELRFIFEGEEKISIGSMTTYADIINSTALNSNAKILCQAAGNVGSHQTRQRGTIGGSIGNASPAGDILIALLVLDAQVLLHSMSGIRKIPLSSIFEAPGKTQIHKKEFIHSIEFSTPEEETKFYFRKIGKRQAMACSVAGVAISLRTDVGNKTIEDARIALGSVAPTPVRVAETENFLKGKILSPDVCHEAGEIAVTESSPIDDVRGTADYRKLMVSRLVKAGLEHIQVSE